MLKKRISPFSVLLVMVLLMIVGAALSPLLNLQYVPSVKDRSVKVRYAWENASARLVEQEVTSRVEGMLAGIRGVKKIGSVSHRGGGEVSVTIKKEADADAVRFEMASLLRQLYPKLPEGVGYPELSVSVSGHAAAPALVYMLHADLPADRIQEYARGHLLGPLSRMAGVDRIDLTGGAPFYWEVAYDPDLADRYGLSADEITAALGRSLGSERVIGSLRGEDAGGRAVQVRVKVKEGGRTEDLESIVLSKAGDRLVTLGDVARVTYREDTPSLYFRVNGLNTVNLAVYPEKSVNVLKMTDKVKAEMARLAAAFPEGMSATVSSDTSVDIRRELDRIVFRTVLTVLILLAFVYAASRSLRYLLVIVTTLLANVLIAFIFYYLLDLDIHIYSLAGITVSLGMIIDTTIIMADHYARYRDRRAFLAILAALLTTIASLVIVFFLPEEQRLALVDFSVVMIVNLTVSLFIAYAFVPAILDRYPLRRRKRERTRAYRARVVRAGRLYEAFLRWMRRRRWAWFVLLVLTFGIPFGLLPPSLKDARGRPRTDAFSAFYNRTIGSDTYQRRWKHLVEPVFGGTLRLFMNNLARGGGYRSPERLQLMIAAVMPEGATIGQLNAVMKRVERFLDGYEQIEMYQTYISSARVGRITVFFREAFEHTDFPARLNEEIIGRVADYGAASWRVMGLEENTFNNLVRDNTSRTYNLRLTGYNYDRLYALAEEIRDRLARNRRVSGLEILSTADWQGLSSGTEYGIDYDSEQGALYGWDARSYYAYLEQRLLDVTPGQLYRDGRAEKVKLVSARKEAFDVWHLENDVAGRGGDQVRLSRLGRLAKRNQGNDIYREDQQYVLTVSFNYIGSAGLARRIIGREVESVSERLPVGYKVEQAGPSGWKAEDSQQYMLLLLVAAIIYFLCAVLFESLVQPLVIILMIPVSFVGVFLTFYLFDFPFDQGGFASFVLLCGIVVNAGIYLVNEYNLTSAAQGRQGLRVYVKAFHRKIVPIALTVLSTVLGLVPFVVDGRQEVFWFSFAVGAMGGMVFSFVAIWVYLPVFLPLGKGR